MVLYPDARLLLVEPNPALFERLHRNVGRFGRVTITRVAVSDRDGLARLHVPSASWSGHLSDRGYPVSTTTLDSLLSKHGFLPVDILKFDIEGAEFRALGVADLFPVNAVVGELHPERAGEIHEFTASWITISRSRRTAIHTRLGG